MRQDDTRMCMDCDAEAGPLDLSSLNEMTEKACGHLKAASHYVSSMSQPLDYTYRRLSTVDGARGRVPLITCRRHHIASL